jgi:hypothetical protein
VIVRRLLLRGHTLPYPKLAGPARHEDFHKLETMGKLAQPSAVPIAEPARASIGECMPKCKNNKHVLPSSSYVNARLSFRGVRNEESLFDGGVNSKSNRNRRRRKQEHGVRIPEFRDLRAVRCAGLLSRLENKWAAGTYPSQGCEK